MKDPLFGNKIAGAFLAALLLFFGLPQLANALFGGGHHGGDVHFAYPVDIEFAGSAEAPAALVDLGTLLAAASPEAGQRRAALCKSCHTFDKGGPNSTGPNLWGVVGRPVATHEGFKFTAALKDFGGQWTYDRLNQFIENSQGYIPGTAMVQRFAKPEQRAELLAYLRTLSDNPAPLPEPVAPSEPAADAQAVEGEEADGAELSPDAAPAAEEAPAATAEEEALETPSTEPAEDEPAEPNNGDGGL